MADFQPALVRTMKFEDPAGTGVVSAEPHGARARFGINSLAHPNLPDSFWSGSADEAFKTAEGIYLADYWQPLQLGGIEDQDVANKIFDMAVNMGTGAAVRLAQSALWSCNCQVTIDGKLGPQTLGAINSLSGTDLLPQLKLQSVDYYNSIELKHPEDVRYDKTWKTRAQA